MLDEARNDRIYLKTRERSEAERGRGGRPAASRRGQEWPDWTESLEQVLCDRQDVDTTKKKIKDLIIIVNNNGRW